MRQSVFQENRKWQTLTRKSLDKAKGNVLLMALSPHKFDLLHLRNLQVGVDGRSLEVSLSKVLCQLLLVRQRSVQLRGFRGFIGMQTELWQGEMFQLIFLT